VTGWYGSSIAMLRMLGTLVVVASAARGFVAFAARRQSFRDRLTGIEPQPQEVG
jgi:hypothetical protein